MMSMLHRPSRTLTQSKGDRHKAEAEMPGFHPAFSCSRVQVWGIRFFAYQAPKCLHLGEGGHIAKNHERERVGTSGLKCLFHFSFFPF